MLHEEDLAIFGGPPAILTPAPHYIWPRITPAVRQAVTSQLERSVSIYDRSGIFLEFEDAFAKYHGRRFALLNNSGTNSLHAAGFALGLQPGDEVICPVYTFFATSSPLISMGVRVVLCDAASDGNVDPEKLAALITPRTRAIFITHMWGVPCQMDVIVEICRRHKIRLVEDCSHAHGARFNDKLVGTFGDLAVWSLQGQKIVTGGEGGILLTDDEELWRRATLLGHYNKRSSQTLGKNHALSEFATTGAGLKHRAHPLAIAMALEQFSHLDEWIEHKTMVAEMFTEAISPFAFLAPPQFDPRRSKPAWYAYVFNYDESKSNGISLEQFVLAVQAEGAHELDRPRSTGPLHKLPLFSRPDKLFPGLFPAGGVQELNQRSFAVAEQFYESALKLPVWAFQDEISTAEQYADALVKVALVVESDPERFFRRSREGLAASA